MASELAHLLSVAECPPAVNQFELSPYNWASRGDVLDICADNEIAIEACSPLTRGRMLGDPALQALAKAYGKSAAQVLIRWARKGLDRPTEVRARGQDRGECQRVRLRTHR
jgi:diketogulonate reductase-like aldo/keto reductase